MRKLLLFASIFLGAAAGAAANPMPDPAPGANGSVIVECGYYTAAIDVHWTRTPRGFQVWTTPSLVFHRQEPTRARERQQGCNAY